MKFLKIFALRGPNIWTYRPVLEVWLDIGPLEDSPSNLIPGFYERLTTWLPSLAEHRCGIGEPGGFLLRLLEGTWPGHILEHVTLELQTLAGMQGGFGKARSTSVRGVYKVVVRSRNETVSRAALHSARDLIMAAIEDQPFDVDAAVKQLRTLVDKHCLGPSTACIVDAATQRGIPSIRLTDGNLVQLGYGARQHRVWTAETDKTSAIAEGISRNKDLTKQLLTGCGIPVPEGRVVESPQDAWEAAEDIGLPVVVKPTDANHGRGVSMDLMTQQEVEAAYALAEAEGSEVLVERFIRGNEHRLLVVNGRVAAAVRGETVTVTGDGVSSIRHLIDTQINSDPRRGEEEEFPLDVLLVDENPAIRFEIQRQGYTPESILPAGVSIIVQRNGNIAFDVTDAVHPEVAYAATLAARVVGLDIAGIDLVAEDIAKPLEAQGGAIVEVNAGPGLLMHLKPAEGQSRPVGKAIVDRLFAEDETGRIPLVGVSGSHGKTEVAKMLARLIHLHGWVAGLACASGLFVSNKQLELGNRATFHAAQKLLMNRKIQAAVIENGFDTILGEGLAYDRCHIGVLTNIKPELHYGDFYIENPEQVYNVFRTQVDVVLESGFAVLNADDPLVASMADLCDGEVIFFAQDSHSAVLRDHVLKGGRAVTVESGGFVLMSPDQRITLQHLSTQSVHQFDIAQVMAVIAAAWALDISLDLISAGIGAICLEMEHVQHEAHGESLK